MRKRGLSHESGFSRTGLKDIQDFFIAAMGPNILKIKDDLYGNNFSKDEIQRIASTAVELLPIFLYWLAHNLIEDLLKESFEKEGLNLFQTTK
jgi:hypothetical protein